MARAVLILGDTDLFMRICSVMYVTDLASLCSLFEQDFQDTASAAFFFQDQVYISGYLLIIRALIFLIDDPSDDVFAMSSL